MRLVARLSMLEILKINQIRVSVILTGAQMKG